ncbi:MAG: hypothetical protein ACN4GR_07025 [Arenicellales bacterium]
MIGSNSRKTRAVGKALRKQPGSNKILMVVPLLLFAITLTSCSHNKLQRCDAVPPWLTNIPDMPSANLSETETNQDVIGVIG